jgi:hypothetical protein
MVPVVLHAGDSAMLVLVGPPAIAAMIAATAALVSLLLFGWRGSLAAAVAGAVFLAAGLTGDLLAHDDHALMRSQLTSQMMMAPNPLAAQQLHALEDAERNNRWHQVAVGGQGLLVTGLAGACFGLWRRSRRDTHMELMVGAIERAAAWPMGNASTPSLWNKQAEAQPPAPGRYRRAAS